MLCAMGRPKRGYVLVWLSSSITATAALAQPGNTPPTGAGPSGPGGWQPPAQGALGPQDPVNAAATQQAIQQAPQPMQQQPPQGSTQATFVSSGAQPWDVLLDRQPVCATPCTMWVEPGRFVSLREQAVNPIRLDVGALPAGSVMVTGTPMREGAYAGGIVGTTFAGMGLATGITLTAVGCSTDRSGMCTAGLITGGVSAVGLYLSIRLMQSALPKAAVSGAQPYVAGSTAGLSGTF